MKTLLQELAISDDVEETVEVDPEKLEEQIADLSLPLSTRLQALILFNKKRGDDDLIEVVNRLSIMFDISGTSVLRQYLVSICQSTELSPFLQSLIATSLATKNTELGYDCMASVYPRLMTMAATPYKIEFLKSFMASHKHFPECSCYFCRIINDTNIGCEYRYKTILSIERIFEKREAIDEDEKETKEDVEKRDELKKQYLPYMLDAFHVFMNNEKNMLSYRIISAQYLLKEKARSEDAENFLLFIAESTETPYNTRADAADIILKYGTLPGKEKAKNIIKQLGNIENKGPSSVYQNAQNVHVEEIEKSVIEIIEFLYDDSRETKGINSVEKVFEKIREKCTPEKNETLNYVFNRITVDRALYTKYNCTVAQVLVKVWNYIEENENREIMQKRLLEELQELPNICSSGYISRIVNSITGFGEFTLRISWKDQIISNIIGRLNAKVRDMDNLILAEKILEEMTIKSDEYERRKHFLKFFRRNISDIREEMYEEFKTHISDNQFEMYFRAGVMMYETGSLK